MQFAERYEQDIPLAQFREKLGGKVKILATKARSEPIVISDDISIQVLENCRKELQQIFSAETFKCNLIKEKLT
jgi:hypothetical protein